MSTKYKRARSTLAKPTGKLEGESVHGSSSSVLLGQDYLLTLLMHLKHKNYDHSCTIE